MREQEIEAPSGLVVVIREFLVRDEDILHDRKAVKSGTAVTKLLDSITNKVVDFGPYEPNRAGNLDWGKALAGDRLHTLMKARINAWGSDFECSDSCPKCGTTVSFEVDLNDLEVKPLPESSKDHVRSEYKDPIWIEKNFGTEEDPVPVKIAFKLTCGDDERKVKKLQKQRPDSFISSLLAFRIQKVVGQDGKELSLADMGKFCRNLPSRLSSEILEAMDEADCGIDFDIEVECDNCGFDFETALRLDSNFLFPSSTRKRKRKR